MIVDLPQLVQRYADAHSDRDGVAVTPLGGIGLVRAYAPTGLIKSIYKPLVCLVLQGAKEVTIGFDTYEFAAGRSAVVCADVPAVSCITRASRTEPYLALAIELDAAILHEMTCEVDGASSETTAASAVLVDDTDVGVAGCALRLLHLLEQPRAILVLRPLIVRELHYWLLTGRHGGAVRGLARPNGVTHRIGQAIAVLRSEYDRPLRVEHLATVAGMSVSTLHHHFRAVTSLSPIQFQKQLRLIEARRQMLGEGLSASRAAYAVGYESVPQFTREYGRMFGLPPGRDRNGSRAP